MKRLVCIFSLLCIIFLGCRPFTMKNPSIETQNRILNIGKDSLMLFLQDTLHFSMQQDAVVVKNNNWYVTFLLFENKLISSQPNISNNNNISLKSSNPNIAQIQGNIINALDTGKVIITIFNAIDSLDRAFYQLTVYTDTNWIYIPDTNFRKSLKALNIPINVATGYMKKIDAIAVHGTLNVSNANIHSLEGIQYFVNVDTLNCSNNKIQTLNKLFTLSQLAVLNCNNNRLFNLDVSQNTLLTQLNCNNNQLPILDIESNSRLIVLQCANNDLVDLKLNTNLRVETIDCSNNQLFFLIVTKNTDLQFLNCMNNKIGAINIINNSLLENLQCGGNANIDVYLSDVQYNTYVNKTNPNFTGTSNWIF